MDVLWNNLWLSVPFGSGLIIFPIMSHHDSVLRSKGTISPLCTWLLIFSSLLVCTAVVQVVLQLIPFELERPKCWHHSRETNLEFVVKPVKSVVLLMTGWLILTLMAAAMFSLIKNDCLQTLICPSSATGILANCSLEHLAPPSVLCSGLSECPSLPKPCSAPRSVPLWLRSPLCVPKENGSSYLVLQRVEDPFLQAKRCE